MTGEMTLSGSFCPTAREGKSARAKRAASRKFCCCRHEPNVVRISLRRFSAISNYPCHAGQVLEHRAPEGPRDSAARAAA